MNAPPRNPQPKIPLVKVLAAIVVTAAVSGYFMGLQQTGSRISLTRPVASRQIAIPHPASPPAKDVPVIVSYREVNRQKSGPNAGFQNDLRQFVSPPARPVLTNATPAQRAAALSERSARRAYDGAPPVVPHPIVQDSSVACLACHGPGLAVKDRVASKPSHAHFANCTQCHVANSGPPVSPADAAVAAPLTGNDFVGVAAPAHGQRAWPGAPPTIPHPTHLRSDCLSCHGPTGLFGLRTPHADRQSCTQCHVPDAELDQRRFRAMLPLRPSAGENSVLQTVLASGGPSRVP